MNRYNTDEFYREKRKQQMREYYRKRINRKKRLMEEFIEFLKSLYI
jgi:hypothetical protein